MPLNGLFCADVPLRNSSLADVLIVIMMTPSGYLSLHMSSPFCENNKLDISALF